MEGMVMLSISGLDLMAMLVHRIRILLRSSGPTATPLPPGNAGMVPLIESGLHSFFLQFFFNKIIIFCPHRQKIFAFTFLGHLGLR